MVDSDYTIHGAKNHDITGNPSQLRKLGMTQAAALRFRKLVQEIQGTSVPLLIGCLGSSWIVAYGKKHHFLTGERMNSMVVSDG